VEEADLKGQGQQALVPAGGDFLNRVLEMHLEFGMVLEDNNPAAGGQLLQLLAGRVVEMAEEIYFKPGVIQGVDRRPRRALGRQKVQVTDN
jgi:hypothetical protein